MRKATIKSLGLNYYIGEGPSPDGLPVFTQAEINILKRSQDTMTPALLKQIYTTKQTFGGTLEEISLRIAEDQDLNQAPQEEIGYTQAPQKKETPGELATRYAGSVIKQLKGQGAKTQKEKQDEQPDLF